ncbi:MAG: acylphosphatase [Candidatus Caldarchaeum sp.]
MAKARVKVVGNIQAVGYRALVKYVARMLGVKGLVRNLDDGSVEVFADAPEESLEKFLKAVDIKGKPNDILSPHVEKMEIHREGEPGYKGPWRSYEAFEIDYGDETTRPVEKDMAESLEWAKLYFTKLVSEFGGLKTGFDNFSQDFKTFRMEFTDFRQEFRDFRQEFRDFRSEFREFRDVSLALSRETLNEVKELRKDLKTILDERLARMERDIAEIKARLGLPQ